MNGTTQATIPLVFGATATPSVEMNAATLGQPTVRVIGVTQSPNVSTQSSTSSSSSSSSSTSSASSNTAPSNPTASSTTSPPPSQSQQSEPSTTESRDGQQTPPNS